MAKFRGTLSGVVSKAEGSYSDEGKPVLRFSIPADTYAKGGKGTNWVRCSMFGDRAEKLFQYVVDGKIVQVSGEISLSTWKDREGVFHANLALLVSDVDLLGSTLKLQQQGNNSAGADVYDPETGGF